MRSLPPSDSDIFNRSNLTPKARALQDGTSKWLAAGLPRACYAVLSTTGGAVFLDKYFHPVRGSWHPGLSTAANDSNLVNASSSGDIATLASIMRSAPSTATQVTSAATPDWAHATCSSGEFGNTVVDVFSNSTIIPALARTNENRLGKAKLNISFINSDHEDRSIAYIQYDNKLRAVSRIDGETRFSERGMTDFTLDYSGYGQCSYNAGRKEFVQVAYFNTGSKGGKKIVLYKNVDFNRYPSPNVALARPEVVKQVTTITTMSGWIASENLESSSNTKCILCDDGSIYLAAHFTSSSLSLFKFTRSGDAFSTTGTVVASRSTGGTTYGATTDLRYGLRLIQSRDGRAVLVFMSYVYYGAGSVAFGIDKENSTLFSTNFAQKTISANGVNFVPYGDDGFACYVAADVTASVGANAVVTFGYRGQGTDWADVSSGSVLSYYPLPKTIYYPALTQVSDFSMLSNQCLV